MRAVLLRARCKATLLMYGFHFLAFFILYSSVTKASSPQSIENLMKWLWLLQWCALSLLPLFGETHLHTHVDGHQRSRPSTLTHHEHLTFILSRPLAMK